MQQHNQYSDVVLILDDDMDQMLARPRQRFASLRGMSQVISYILSLRARLTANKVLVHDVMQIVAAEMRLEGGAMGPIAYMADLYGDAAVDDPRVLAFFRAWITRCKVSRK